MMDRKQGYNNNGWGAHIKRVLSSSRRSEARSGIYAIDLAAQTPDKCHSIFRGDVWLCLVALFFFFLTTLFPTSSAQAACTNPAGVAGEMRYNWDEKMMQYCNDTDWVSMAHRDYVDRLPDSFDFTDQTGVVVSIQIESDIVQITGIGVPVNVSISGTGSPEYRVCNDGTCSGAPAYTSTAGSISNNQYIQLRLTSGAGLGTTRIANVDVGLSSADWSVSTLPADDTPDAFDFTDVTNANIATVTSSDILQITGITGDVPTSITGAGTPQYRICTDGSSEANCDGSVVQNWTGGSGLINNNQYIQLRLTSSGSSNTLRSATMTIGTGNDQWDVTTLDGHVDADCTGLGDANVNNASTGHCYWRVDTADTWANAKSACEAQSGHLVTIVDATEHSYLINNNMVVASNMFMGASDADSEGVWRWVGGDINGMPFWYGMQTSRGGAAVGSAYTSWQSNEPNNSGSNGVFEDAGSLEQSTAPNWNWNDQGVADSLDYICEKDDLGFEDQIETSTSTLTTSNIYQINGISGDVTISVSGTGSPQYRICTDSGCGTVPHDWGSAAGTVNNGEYVQLRLTSNGSQGTSNYADLTIGESTDQWRVQTAFPAPTLPSIVGSVSTIEQASGAAEWTHSHLLPSGGGSSRILIIAMHHDQSKSNPTQYGGVSASFAASQFGNNLGSNNDTVFRYILEDDLQALTAGQSHDLDVFVGVGSALRAGRTSIILIQNAKQAEPELGESGSTGTSVSTNITTQDDNTFLLDILTSEPRTQSATVGSGQTQLYQEEAGQRESSASAEIGAVSTKAAATAGVHNMSWSLSTSDDWGHIILGIEPVPQFE